jgi:predicted DNA-binding transcriptional regulator AlpA
MSHALRRKPALVAPVPQAEALVPSIRPGVTLAAAIEPLLGIEDLATLLNCSRRAIERLRAGGKFPPPSIKIGKMPRWTAQVIRDWIAEGSKP